MTIFLTAEGGILGPIAMLFGYLMNGIYIGLEKIGIGNIGLAIIIFTLITRILLHPFTVQQQKSMKLNAIIQPEIKAIQEKYRGRTDQQSIMSQQAEMKQVYEKYGTSMTGSCVQLLIQMPIIFALYRVIMNVPAYVLVIKQKYYAIIDAMGSNADSIIRNFINSNADVDKVSKTIKNIANFETLTGDAKKNVLVDFLYKLNPTQFSELSQNFSSDVQNVLNTNIEYINNANSFLGLNLATAPSAHGFISPYILIPILACISQYLSVMIMQKQSENKHVKQDENDQMQQTMKSMNVMMPIMSAVFCYGFATGIGIYWISSSLFMLCSQLIVNAQLKNLDVDELIKKNIEKTNIKRAKKGLPPINPEKTAIDIEKREQNYEKEEQKRNELLENQKQYVDEAEKFYFENENKDSLFAKANMVKKYNEKNNK